MKKALLLSMALFLIWSAAFTQTKKGNYLVGGSLNLSLGETTFSNEGFSVLLSGRAGQFIIDDVAVGLAPSIIYHIDDNVRSLALGIAPLIRYLFPTKNKIRFFVEGHAGILHINTINRNDEVIFEGYTATEFLGSAGFGLSYFLTENVGLEGLLSYNSNNHFANLLNSNLTFTLGFQVYLPGKNSAD